MSDDARTSRLRLLDEFRLTATKYYGGTPIEPSLEGLLPHLIYQLPDAVFFEPQAPIDQGQVDFTGEFDEDSADALITSLMEIHLNAPHEVPIRINLSSNGGDVCAGMAVIGYLNILRRAKREVRIHVTGWAHSIAFDVLQHADHRSMESTAFLMTHQETYGAEDNTNTNHHDAEVAFSKAAQKTIYTALAKRTGRTADYYIRKISAKPWYISAPEAMLEGLIDEITETPKFKPVPVPVVKTPRKKKAADAGRSPDNNPDAGTAEV